MGPAGGTSGWRADVPARAACIVGAVFVALGCTLLPVFVANRQPGAGNLVVGLVLMVAGAELLAVSATRVSGFLLVAAAVAWFVPDVAPALPDGLADVVARAALLHVVLIVAAMVALAGRQRYGRGELIALVAGVGAGVSGALGGYQVAVPLAGLALLIVGLGRVRRTPGRRRGRAYYVASLTLASLALSGVPVARNFLSGSYDPGLSLVYGTCLAGAGLALTLAGDWCRRTHALDVGADGLVALDRLVADLAGDPGAQVVVRVDGGRWVGLDGVDMPPPAEAEVATVAIVSRRAVAATPDLEQALQLASRTIRARDEEKNERRSLERLRARLVTAEADERSALEARLRSGPLAALSVVESQLSTAQASPALMERVSRVRGGIETLARGLDPLAGLTLPEAVASLVADSLGSVATEAVDVDPAGARAMWFACSETLANVAKHGSGSKPRVNLTATTDGALLTVSDDHSWTPGTPRGGGLQRLDDRLAAVGGSMIIEQVAGRTTVEIRVPRRTPPSQHVENPADLSDPRPGPTLLASYPPTSEVGS